ncbi:hypothetical protein BGX28_003038 [Mortierella sp. GBA30]|nr:hypothetical protein BGX28_003038 [Mortierella sp. GBA30]
MTRSTNNNNNNNDTPRGSFRKESRHRSRHNQNQSHNSKNSDPFDQKNSPAPIDPDLHRIFFRSPDKIRSLEDAQVFISHIKSSYGPLTQYQFSRCPETKKYFGYGFLTFKNKESLDRALQDGYIRVGMKDFELIRTGHMPSKKGPIYQKTGFLGFNNLEELRAKRAHELKVEQPRPSSPPPQQQSNQNRTDHSDTESESTMTKRTMEESSSSVTLENVSESEPFISALNTESLQTSPSSSISASASATSTSHSLPSSTTPASNSSSGSKPYFVPLQKKSMAQLWKTIPEGIERAERSLSQNVETEDKTDDNDDVESVISRHDESSKVLAARIVGDMLEKNQ